MNELLGMHADKVQIITPDDGYHYFFAYYDMRATGAKGKHLCHRVKFMDRLPTAEDVCELGVLEDGKFSPFATTTAWNFQQGAMLQYHPTKENVVYYNVCENDCFMTVTHDLRTGKKQYPDRATACVSPDGRWGLSVNFGRIYGFRPGYGYAGFVDEKANTCWPFDDGVFLTDMEKGTSRLLCSYAQIGAAAGFAENEKILVNHITFSPDCDRYLMLVRKYDNGDKSRPWWNYSSVLIGDRKGNFYPACKTTYFSHYYWVADDAFIAHCTVEGNKKSLYRISVTDGHFTEYAMPYFEGEGNRDIHCILSPNGTYIIGDGYPLDGYRHLVAYNLQTGESRDLFAAKSVAPPVQDIRCDLHARFVWGGEYISFDTTHNDRRQVALLPTKDVLNF